MKSISIIHPSRQRPLMAYETAQKWLSTRTSIEIPFEYILSIDTSDDSLDLYLQLFEVLKQSFYSIKIIINDNKSCIQASNNGAKISENNLLILVSDDFDCFEGWDTWLLQNLEGKEDFIVKTSDKYQPRIITLPIMDRKYYNRFGYIYYHEYEHLFCDTEMTEVAHLLNKVIDLQDGVHHFVHKHWTTGLNDKDELNKKNDATWNQGEKLFEKRKKENFNIMLLSILICSLEKREESLNKLLKKLNNTYDDVEILVKIDNGENSVGKKRNLLIEDAKGKYICFVDDDDEVCDNYISLIREGCLTDSDCLSLNGIITFDGFNPKLFVHSLKYKTYSEDENSYYRPPNHLNTIKKSLIKNIKFKDIYNGEDFDWAMLISNLGILKTEYEIKEVIYYYIYKEFK